MVYTCSKLVDAARARQWIELESGGVEEALTLDGLKNADSGNPSPSLPNHGEQEPSESSWSRYTGGNSTALSADGSHVLLI